MFRKILFIAVCLSFFISANCLAEERKDEWQEKAIDFTTVRTVVVQLSVNSDVVVKDIDQKKLDDLLEKQILKAAKQRVRLISNSQLEDSIGKIVNTDMALLSIADNAKYLETMQAYAPLVADAILRVNVKALGTTQVFVPQSMYTYTEYQTTYVSTPVFLPGGRVYYTTTAIQTPVMRTMVVPAHNENVGHAGAEFTLVTCKNQQKIWLLLDMRDGKEKVPLEMTERIFQRAMDQFRELTDYKKR